MPLVPQTEVPPLKYQDPVMIERDIAYLREWISKQNHLPQEHDDAWLKSFLIGCKSSLEKCKRKIDGYFSLRVAYAHLLSNRDPASEEIRATTECVAQFILPNLHPDGYLLGFGKFINLDTKLFDPISVLRKISISGDVIIRQIRNHGIVILVDLEGSSLQHVMKVTPDIIKIILLGIEEAYPFTLVEFHLINIPSFVEVVKKLVRTLLPEKMKKRFYFHNNVEDVFNYIPNELLPNEYGGKAGTVLEINEKYQRKLESYRESFLKDAEKVTDESKRVGKCLFEKSVYGLEGSFRQMEID